MIDEKTEITKDDEVTKVEELAEQAKAIQEKYNNILKMEKCLALKLAGLPILLADFINAEADVNEFIKAYKAQMSDNGYTPTERKKASFDGMTKEKFNSLAYSERAKLYEQNPELVKALL